MQKKSGGEKGRVVPKSIHKSQAEFFNSSGIINS